MTKGPDEKTTYTLVEFFNEVQRTPDGAAFYEEPSCSEDGEVMVFESVEDAVDMARFMLYVDDRVTVEERVRMREPHAPLVGILVHDFDASLGVPADDDFDGESCSYGWVTVDGVLHEGDYESAPYWNEHPITDPERPVVEDASWSIGRYTNEELEAMTPDEYEAAKAASTGGASLVPTVAGGFSLRVGTHLVGTRENPEFHDEPCLEIVDDRGKRVDSWSLAHGEHALKVLARLNSLPRQTRCALCGETVTSGDPERYPYCKNCHYTGRAATFIRRAQVARFERLIPGSRVAVEHTGGGCMWMAVRFEGEETFYAMTDGEASLPTIQTDDGETVDLPFGGWGYVGRYNLEETPDGMPVSDDYEGTPIAYVEALLEGQGEDGEGLSDEQAAYAINLDRAVRRGKREILSDALSGRLTGAVAGFSDLHDYVDANEYGGLCDDDQPYRGDDGEGGDEQWLRFGNDVQDALDNWIKAGGLRTAMEVK